MSNAPDAALPSGSGNLAVALALAKAGLPIFHRLTFNQKKQKCGEPHVKGW
jgi:hypothetical protein